MEVKLFYLLCSVVLAKAHMTTICVEIKPSSPQEVPYYMCKGAEVVKSGESDYRPIQETPPVQPNYGSEMKFQSPNNENNYGKSPIAPNNNNYGPTFPSTNEGYPNAEQSAYQKYTPPAIYNEQAVPKQQNGGSYPTTNQAQSSVPQQSDYANDNYQQPPVPPSDNYQQSPFQKFHSLFANIKTPNLFAPKQSQVYDSIYEDQQEKQTPKDSSPAPPVYPIKSSPIGNKENYEAASTPYSNKNNGAYGATSYNNDARSLSNSQRQQQNQPTSKASSGQSEQQPRSPFGVSNIPTASAIPNANAAQPYGIRNLPYANPKGPQGVANPIATKPSTSTAANAYVAPSAQKPPASASTPEAPQSTGYLNEPNRPLYDTLAGTSQLQPTPRLSSRHRAMMDDDVLDMPNIEFTHDELRQFHGLPEQTSMLRIPDNRNTRQPPFVGASPPLPPGIIISGLQRSIPLPGNPVLIGFPGQLMTTLSPHDDDDPVMRTFYGDQNEPDLLGQNKVMAEAFPIYPPQTINQQNLYPPQQQPPNRLITTPPKSTAYNPYEQSGYLDDGRCLNCPNSAAPIQRPPLQCIAASDNGPTYAQPMPPNCVPRDYNIQPIFIAMPCYGQQPAVQVGSAQIVPMQQFPQPQPPQNSGPMTGSPLGLGGPLGPLGPFGMFGPFNPFNPFRGMLGANNPNFPNHNIGPLAPPMVGSANQLGQFNFPTLRGMSQRNQQQEMPPANGRAEKMPEQWKPKVTATNANNKKTKVTNFTTEEPKEINESSSIEESSDENMQQQNQGLDNMNPDPTVSETTTPVTGTTGTTSTSVESIGKGAEKVSEVFTDSLASTEDQTEDLSANSYLNLAEEKLQNSTPTEVKPSDLRKRQNVKTINSMLKRKYLQKY